ncbi:hypothetical protein MPSEU_000641600 [Mayamaea pseudoterrestris]|nr:hypothetical protein MPSEU_000641600 [Mayamaea pseudoterrestris]
MHGNCEDCTEWHSHPLSDGNEDSLLNLALVDHSAVCQRHDPQIGCSGNNDPTGHATIAELFDMPDELLFAGMDDINTLMQVPMITLADEISHSDSCPQINASVPIVSPPTSPQGAMKKPVRLDNDGGPRFREYQSRQWLNMFNELCMYKQIMGDCLVPHRFVENPALGRWVKRQRYQMKLLQDGETSTMTLDRAQKLANIGFVWDSQGVAWAERLVELKEFKAKYGHVQVNMSDLPEHFKLATWIKCQRRQHKLYQEGQPSNITPQRIAELEKLGIQWEIRGAKRRASL